MKKLILLGLAIAFSFTGCIEQPANHKQQSPTIKSFRSVSNSFTMKQKIEKEFQLLDFSKLVSQLKAF